MAHYKLCTGFVFLCWAVVIWFSLIANTHAPLFNLPVKNSAYISTFMPQGWAFFTRSPREPQLYVYRIENNHISKVDIYNASVASLFGMRRTMLASRVEVGALISTVNKKEWKSYNKELSDSCLFDSIPVKIVENKTQAKSFCGEYLFQYQEPLPWAWNNVKRKVVLPSLLIRLKISCDGK